MKVNQYPTSTTQGIEKAKTEPAKARIGKDSVSNPAFSDTKGTAIEISEEAHLMQKAMEVAKDAPDFRADKVAGLKKAILNGTYHVDAAAIADKLVDEHLRTDFGKNNL